MHTTCSLPHSEVSVHETPLDSESPQTETPMDRDPPEQRPFSVNRMTHTCKNITLLQTSFAGSKNWQSNIIYTWGLKSIH